MSCDASRGGVQAILRRSCIEGFAFNLPQVIFQASSIITKIVSNIEITMYLGISNDSTIHEYRKNQAFKSLEISENFSIVHFISETFAEIL